MADLSKTELMAHANEAIKIFGERGLTMQAYFKSTCPRCGERVTFNEPNVIYDNVECCGCGHVYPFERGGYMVKILKT